ncbi:Mitochondrial import inner membrane translocase subunit tim23 [Hypsizygus marmoreus]|uniref:Mitochondrial import inner membrane translocase subunit tim23 n=1 Tax=Hypsizygus marmoreus TaxID=39966 RepID=A0A369JNK9_HYPMA|nr:Mitochondrial import inner membrane translocase subunit tim23 [Hypsizygus marmoreus]
MSSTSSPDPQSGASSSQNPSDYLRSATFTRPEGAPVSSDNAVQASDFLMAAYDPTKLHPLAQLGDQLDYLLLDDDKKSEVPGASTAIPSRGWSDDLCYGTGTMYLSGLALGGVWGVREGARRPLAVSNTRLRINSVLNSVTRRGTFIGNSAGVLALLYNGVNSSIDALRGKHDTLGSMAAGALTGALFKSTAGVKPAIAAATFMSAMAGLWSYVKKSRHLTPRSLMFKDSGVPQDHTNTPHGSSKDRLEAESRRPEFSSNHTTVGFFTSRRLWFRQCHSEPKACYSAAPLHMILTSAFNLYHHVLSPNPNPFSSRRGVKTNRRYRQESRRFLFTRSHKKITLASSGQPSPSPQSSVASSVFSSCGSSCSHSPPSSQASFSETPSFPAQIVRRQPRIQVSSLLADPYTRTYHLDVIQQPQKTAEFGDSNLSRLPLTPPIIARLTVRDPSGNTVVPEAELPFLIAHLSLFSGDGLTALDMGSSIGRGQSPPLLYGNLVSSIDQLEDLQGNMGLFFVFPDVSIRWRGQFQLGITVMRISRSDPSGGMSVADEGTVLAETRTQTFDVLPHNHTDTLDELFPSARRQDVYLHVTKCLKSISDYAYTSLRFRSLVHIFFVHPANL